MKRSKILFMCTLPIISCLMTGCSSSDYKKAAKLSEDGEYEEAAAVYESLGDYKDAADLAQECHLDAADAAYADADYETAAGIYENLGDYANAAQSLADCRWYLGKAAYESGDWETAVDTLEGISGTPADADGPEAETMSLLAQANIDFTNGDYAAVLAELDDYEGKASEQIYADAAYNEFSEELDQAASAYDAEASNSAISKYLERTNTAATVNFENSAAGSDSNANTDSTANTAGNEAVDAKLAELFGTLIACEDYSAFTYMDAILAADSEKAYTTQASALADSAYEARVSAYLCSGSWKRMDGISMKGAIMDVTKNDDGSLIGTLTNVDGIAGSYLFFVGDIKWKELDITSADHFTFSDYFVSYSGHTITARKYVTAKATINYSKGVITVTEAAGTSGNGATQTWQLQ